MTRTAPALAVETAPLWGFACGALAGCVLGALAAFAGGPLGDNRLAAVGPSGWQVGVVAALEVGVAAAVTAGVANWLRLRAVAGLAVTGAGKHPPRREAADDGHTIYVDPWAGPADQGCADPAVTVPRAPSSLPSSLPGER
jgi:hypothetical protein